MDPTQRSRPHQRASLLLVTILQEFESSHVSLEQLLRRLGERAFGLVLLLFALPNCIPGPPFLGSILGLPLLFFGVQLTLGCRFPWLPSIIGRYTVKRETLVRLALRGRPMLERLERICRPRLPAVTGPTAERVFGMAITLLAAAVMIPLPFTNFIPAVGIGVISLGLLEEDGVTILAGVAIGIVGMTIVSGVLVTAGAFLSMVFG